MSNTSDASDQDIVFKNKKNKGADLKAPHVCDPFFASAVPESSGIEKRVVTRDGKVPKLEKNILKEKEY